MSDDKNIEQQVAEIQARLNAIENVFKCGDAGISQSAAKRFMEHITIDPNKTGDVPTGNLEYLQNECKQLKSRNAQLEGYIREYQAQIKNYVDDHHILINERTVYQMEASALRRKLEESNIAVKRLQDEKIALSEKVKSSDAMCQDYRGDIRELETEIAKLKFDMGDTSKTKKENLKAVIDFLLDLLKDGPMNRSDVLRAGWKQHMFTVYFITEAAKMIGVVVSDSETSTGAKCHEWKLPDMEGNELDGSAVLNAHKLADDNVEKDNQIAELTEALDKAKKTCDDLRSAGRLLTTSVHIERNLFDKRIKELASIIELYTGENPIGLEPAIDLINTILADGPQNRIRVYSMAVAKGISKDAIYAASKMLGIVEIVINKPGRPEQISWNLPYKTIIPQDKMTDLIQQVGKEVEKITDLDTAVLILDDILSNGPKLKPDIYKIWREKNVQLSLLQKAAAQLGVLSSITKTKRNQPCQQWRIPKQY